MPSTSASPKALSLLVLSGEPEVPGRVVRLAGPWGQLTLTLALLGGRLEWRLSDLNCNSAAMEARRSFSGTLEPCFNISKIKLSI